MGTIRLDQTPAPPHRRLAPLSLLAPVLLLAGCALPPVELSTPEPVKVDVNVRLDVYQHRDPESREPPPDTDAADDTASIELRRRNRMGDIQLFKNSRIVGENRNGLLEIIEPPPGEYGAYVQSVVNAENRDRLTLMRRQAEAGDLDLAAIQSERARLWRDRAFSGEWIEVPVDDGATYQWRRKGADS